MQELADLLKAERLKQGLTVSTVSERTRISASMIEALEAGEFERIGIPLIIRSFIRSYCEALGLDSRGLMEKYESHIGTFDRQRRGIRKYGEWGRALRRKGRSRVLLIFLLVLLAVGTLVGGAWFSIWLKRQQATEKSSGVFPSQDLPSDLIGQGGALASVDGMERTGVASAHTSPADPELGKAAGPASSGHGATAQRFAGVAANPNGQGPSAGEILPEEGEGRSDKVARHHVLEVEALRKTLVKLRIDDQPAVSVTMKRGEKREWQILAAVEISLRQVQSVVVKWDGVAVENGKGALRLPLKEQIRRP
jgi:cytoskeletal protein RodZ